LSQTKDGELVVLYVTVLHFI